MVELAILLTSHFFGDFVFQSEWMCKEKAKHHLFLFAHTWIWTFCVILALYLLGLFEWWKCPFLFIGHYLMDYYKCNVTSDDFLEYHIFPGDDFRYKRSVMYLDQLFHLAQLMVVYYL